MIVVAGVLLVLLRFAPGWSVGIAVVLAIVGSVSYVWMTRASAAARQRAEILVNRSNPNRVRCAGTIGHIARMVELGEIDNRMFEPFVARAAGAFETSARRAAVQALVGVIVGGGAVAIPLATGMSSWTASLNFIMPLCFGAGMLAGSMAFPTYLRIVPGRLDVIEYGVLGFRIERIRRFDLRAVSIEVDLHQDVLRITEPSGLRVVAFGGVHDRWGCAHAALMGAVSTYTPPPLPDDALVG